MVPPKYNFFVGRAKDIFLSSGVEISDSGEIIVPESATNKYAAGLFELENNEHIYVNLISANSYNAIFFYNSSEVFIEYQSLNNTNKTIIIPPTKAKYYAFRFTTDDAAFNRKKDTDFIYTGRYVTPHYKSLSKKYEKENDQAFFRQSLDGKITLVGDDYTFIHNFSIEDSGLFIICKEVSNKYTEYYKGRFSKTDCKFDYDKKLCELKTEALDAYTTILEKYEDTYDLLKLGVAVNNISLHKRFATQIYIRGGSTASVFFSSTYSDVEAEATDSHDYLSEHFFKYFQSYNEINVSSSNSELEGVYIGKSGKFTKARDYEAKNGTRIRAVSNGVFGWEDHLFQLQLINKDGAVVGITDEMASNAIDDRNTSVIYDFNTNYFLDPSWISKVDFKDATGKIVATISSLFVYHVYGRVICDVDTIGSDVTYAIPVDDFISDNFNYKKCIGANPNNTFTFFTNATTENPTRYGMNDNKQYFTSAFLPTTAAVGPLYPICRGEWVNTSLWFAYNSAFYETQDRYARKKYTFRDGYALSSVIQTLLKEIDSTLVHEPTIEYSQFLYGYSSLTNLVGFRVFMTQKTNILKGEYDQPAQKAEITFKELTDMLRNCFRCYWYIDNGKFKIEHIRFFMNGGTYDTRRRSVIDITDLEDQFNKKKVSYFQHSIEYEKSNLPAKYEFNWQDDVTDLFGNTSLNVKSNYVKKDNTEEINVSQFSSDVDFMLLNPDNFSDDGFALLCPTIPSINFTWSCIKIKLYAGDEVSIDALGVAALADSNKRLLAVYTCKGTGEKVSFTAEQNGYLYINNAFSYLNFSAAVSGYTYNYAMLQKGYSFVGAGEIDDIITETVNSDISLSATYALPIVRVNGLIDENGNIYSALIQNYYASWLYLIKLYMWDMPAWQIESDRVSDLVVRSIQRSMKQTILLPTKEDINPMAAIQTNIGSGYIESISIDLDTRISTIDLQYEPK